jgi:site-specific recombinase XerD
VGSGKHLACTRCVSVPPGHPASSQQPRLLDRLRAAIRARHYSRSTESAYVAWIRRFILYNQKRHPATLGVPEVNAYLTHLAMQRGVSASTQKQACSALLFLYGQVLGTPLGALGDIVRARRPTRLPVVLTRHEIDAVMPPSEDRPGSWRLSCTAVACGCSSAAACA